MFEMLSIVVVTLRQLRAIQTATTRAACSPPLTTINDASPKGWSQKWAHEFSDAANRSEISTSMALSGLPWAQGAAGSNPAAPTTFRVPGFHWGNNRSILVRGQHRSRAEVLDSGGAVILMRAAPSTSARAPETNVTLAVPRPFVLGKHPILSARRSCPPSPNTRQRWTVCTCPTTVRIFITGSGFKSRATRFIWSSPGRSRNFRQRVEPEFVQLGPLPRASMSSRSPHRCHDPTSQSIAGSCKSQPISLISASFNPSAVSMDAAQSMRIDS